MLRGGHTSAAFPGYPIHEVSGSVGGDDASVNACLRGVPFKTDYHERKAKSTERPAGSGFSGHRGYLVVTLELETDMPIYGTVRAVGTGGWNAKRTTHQGQQVMVREVLR